MRSIDAFQELSKSPNAKVIVTDGKTPFLIKD
jgi:prohibitin 1